MKFWHKIILDVNLRACAECEHDPERAGFMSVKFEYAESYEESIYCAIISLRKQMIDKGYSARCVNNARVNIDSCEIVNGDNINFLLSCSFIYYEDI